MISAGASTSRQLRRDGADTSAFADLRAWLAHLDATGRLAIAKPGARLEFEIAGIANRLDGEKASLCPQPQGREGCVVSGVVSDRGWMAEALGRFLAAQTERSGAVVAYGDPAPGAPRYSKYYTGEAFWALGLLARSFPDDDVDWREAAATASSARPSASCGG